MITQTPTTTYIHVVIYGILFTSDWLANKVILININCLSAILRNEKLSCFTRYIKRKL